MFNLRSAHRLAIEAKPATLIQLAYREHRSECNTCSTDEVCDEAAVLLTAVGFEQDEVERWL